MNPSDAFAQMKFRDPARARGLRDALERLVRDADHAPVSVMHVCGSHEQAIEDQTFNNLDRTRKP